ncbi:MAG: hypothetical protein ABIP19_04470 [Dermatophilaceae bacterium]
MVQTHDKSISFWDDTNLGFNFPLDPAFGASGLSASTEPALQPGTPVTVTIIPRDFNGPDWQVEVVGQSPSGG